MFISVLWIRIVVDSYFLVSPVREKWCWEPRNLEVDVKDANLQDIRFNHAGFLLKCTLSHNVTLVSSAVFSSSFPSTSSSLLSFLLLLPLRLLFVLLTQFLLLLLRLFLLFLFILLFPQLLLHLVVFFIDS